MITAGIMREQTFPILLIPPIMTRPVSKETAAAIIYGDMPNVSFAVSAMELAGTIEPMHKPQQAANDA